MVFRRIIFSVVFAVLGLAVSSVAVAKKAQPVSPEILEATTMRFWVDSSEFVVPYELLKDAAEDKTLNSDDFIQKYYEPLRAALPKYVSRDSIGLDDLGKYTMWCYTFTPRKYKKTVYLQAGIHGRDEFESYYAAGVIMRLIANAKKTRNPHLKYLRKNVRFVVLPVVNVFDTHERTYHPFNGNKININKDWVDEQTQEMRNVKSVLSRFAKGEIQQAFDLHTDPEGIPGWGAYLLSIAENMPSSISDKLIAINNFLYEKNVPGKVKYKGADLYKAFMGPGPEYPASSREWREHRHENYKRRVSCAGSCTAGIWADYGIPCATLEHGSRKFGPSGSPIEITRAVELYLNHIVAQIEYR